MSIAAPALRIPLITGTGVGPWRLPDYLVLLVLFVSLVLWWWLRPSKGGTDEHTAGSFRTPAGSGTVSIDGLGFDPDLLLFVATNRVATTGADVPSITDGWTYGKAHCSGGASNHQNVVSVAHDARSDKGAIASARTGQVIHIPLDGRSGDTGADTLSGALERTTDDGFVVRFDRTDDATDRRKERYSVVFEAFSFDDGASVEVGEFVTPSAPGAKAVDWGVDADHVVATGCFGVDEIGATGVTEGPVGVSHGAATEHRDEAGDTALGQRAVASHLALQNGHRNADAAVDDAVITLGQAPVDDVSTTTARATRLGRTLALDFDRTAGSSPVTYGAVDCEGRAPELGHFPLPDPAGSSAEPTAASESPDPDEAHTVTLHDDGAQVSVDIGFRPGVVEFTACPVHALGDDPTVDESPLAFRFSHGVALPDDGGVETHLLHSSRDSKHVSGGESAWTSAGVDASSGGGAGATDEGPPVAAVHAVDAAGRIFGRDEARVVRMTDTGFELEVTSVDAVRRTEGERGRRPLVFYTAWPEGTHQTTQEHV